MTPSILIAWRPHPFTAQVDVVHGSALVSYNAGISACEKGAQWQPALSLLSDMRAAKLEPTVISSIWRTTARART
eukprot:7656432-Pyramimonas_sp.AAC.1